MTFLQDRQQFLGAPRWVPTAHLEDGLDDVLRRLIGAGARGARAILQTWRTGCERALDPLVTRLTTDAVQGAQLGDRQLWEETLGPLETLGVLVLLSGEQALTREITAIPTPGHTPGSMSLVIVSGGQRALIIGDVTTNPAQVTEPGWGFLAIWLPPWWCRRGSR